MNDHEREIQVARARQAAIDGEINALMAERSRLDERVSNLGNEIRRMELPCWQCQQPGSIDVRHWLNSITDIQALAARSIGGKPPGCCQIHTFKPRGVSVGYA
jgi:hypothetical protein